MKSFALKKVKFIPTTWVYLKNWPNLTFRSRQVYSIGFHPGWIQHEDIKKLRPLFTIKKLKKSWLAKILEL